MTAPIPSLYRLPAFWRGAANTRDEFMRRYGEDADPLAYHRAIAAREAIAAELDAGVALEEIAAFRDWAASAHGKPAGAPDPLDVVRR